MPSLNIKTRPAVQSDLDAINHVIEAAIETWDLPKRVKRLSLSSYRYTMMDISYLEMVVAEDDSHTVIGVAAWEPADAKDTPADETALLLHGIYVDPAQQHRGIGTRLFRIVEQAVREHHYSGLLVKAQESASGFFSSQGMEKLGASDPQRHYEHRFWKSTGQLDAS
jgi:predicted N-acetyltransferase YhbS